MPHIRLTAPAKLNLFLHVTGKRADGYHLLESLVAFSEFGDALEIKASDALTLEITGSMASALEQPNENNLIMKAARLLQAHSGCTAGAHMVLEKHIPVGAGVGGGSADAAAALLALKKLWNIDINDADLQKLGLRVGSDVPVCLARQTAWMSGIGEGVAPVHMPIDAWVVLVNPRISVMTADIFRRFSSPFAKPCPIPASIDSFDALIGFLESKENMLETPAKALMPVIADMLAAIGATQGCRLSGMSGSGATCFGLYENEADAHQAAQKIQHYYPAWWSVATKLMA